MVSQTFSNGAPALLDNEVSELLTQPNNKNTDKQTKENFIFNITNNLFY
jgi:hypothetical protein